MGKRLVAASVLGSFAVGLTFAACGLDEGGTLDTSDGSVSPDVNVADVQAEANPPVLDCIEAGTPLDASCLGKPVPTGWQPIAVQVGVTTDCGDGGFTSAPLVTNPQLPTGACQCTGCTATGTWSCGATLKAGTTCTENTFDAGASACWVINHSSLSETLTRSGNPQCNASTQVGSQDASTTAVTTCTPQSCTTDFCGMGAKGFSLCIWNPSVTDGTCPTDFPASHVVGPKANVACDSCQQCGLTNASSAQCTGVAIGYQNNDCTGNVVTTATSNGQCQNPSGNFASVFYDAGAAPVPNCGAPTGTATGKATLASPSTICCLQ